jgi:hypothetical protein
MINYPTANVITIDDDVFYPPDLIYKLKMQHKKYPNAIICCLSRIIKAENDNVKPYKEWKYFKSNSKPSFNHLPIGVGGTLYPVHSLHIDAFNEEKLCSMALKTDDLWLKIMSLKQQTRVVSIAGEYSHFFIPIIYRNNLSLMTTNIGEGQNDIIFKNLMEHFKIPLSIFES